MKNIESTYNQWLDGSLDEADRQQFESTLDKETLASAKAWPQVRQLLKESAEQITLPHPDFLNEQILREIERGNTRASAAVPLPRLIWAGAFCVAAAVVLTMLFLPLDKSGNGGATVFLAETSAPGASASIFRTPGDRGAVIWLEGISYIPDGERVQ